MKTGDMASDEKIFAIRIDESKCCDDAWSFELDCAITLLNYGTANRCLAIANAKGCNRLLSASYSFFHIAYDVLARQSATLRRSIDDAEAVRILLVSVLVMQNLVQLSDQLEIPEKNLECRVKLFHLRQAILHIEQNNKMSFSTKTTASAA
jgi:hypothetical protein